MIRRQKPEEPAWAKYITEDNLPTEDLQYLCSIIGIEATKKLMDMINRHIDRDVKEYKEKNNYPIKRKR